MGQAATHMTVDEYLAIEPEEGVKYEWINGEIYAMAGGVPWHAVATGAIIRELGNKLAGGPCTVPSSDQRLYMHETEAYVYPDAMVVCAPWKMAPQEPTAVTNPSLVVEVLSPSTANYDRGAKMEHYTRLNGLRDVLIVDTRERNVTHHTRTSGAWERREYGSGVIPLPNLDIELSVDAVFADLETVPDL